jgi:hypothetical protein
MARRYWFHLALIITIIFSGPRNNLSGIGIARARDGEKIAVMVVATYHMDNPGRDILNMKVDDVLAPKRQNELDELVHKLAAFRPTKIAVECPYPFISGQGEEGPNRKSSSYVKRYLDYRRGEMAADRNEVYQVGFRLGRYQKHERIYGIDADSPSGLDAPIKFANENGQGHLFEDLIKRGQSSIRQMEHQLARMTISQFLKRMNSAEALLENHQYYLGYFIKMGKDRNYSGADAVAGWYQRNLRIFTNLDRIAQPGDRVLVLFGQGHCHILRQLVADAPGYNLVDPADYL